MDNKLLPGPAARPYRIGFLLIDGFGLMSYSATLEPLRAANLLAGKILYEIHHLPAAGARATSSSGAIIRANAQVGEQVDFDLMLVVAGGDPFSFRDERLFQWLRHLSRRRIWLGGVSGGPVILARAGLLRGRRATVHWEHAPTMTELFPDLLLEKTLYVMDHDRMTCAGGTAPLDMMHALITGHHGIHFARQVCDWFMHTEIRPSGNPQRAGLAERYHTHHPALLSTIELMQNNLAIPLDLPQLARLASLTTRQLNRLFHDKLHQSTMAFYRDLRLEKARNLLLQSPLSITRIALATGFGSSAHFSQAYRTKYGEKPSVLRGRRIRQD
ncbi:MAG: GlxA family transcriptional regulator [Thiothrix sp.]|nr:GlxA family transcriptional regulator [Thiothrix sp.]HPQ94774.1 GlxA family transcriptional regulator [Thiolinea sp.]